MNVSERRRYQTRVVETAVVMLLSYAAIHSCEDCLPNHLAAQQTPSGQNPQTVIPPMTARTAREPDRAGAVPGPSSAPQRPATVSASVEWRTTRPRSQNKQAPEKATQIADSLSRQETRARCRKAPTACNPGAGWVDPSGSGVLQSLATLLAHTAAHEGALLNADPLRELALLWQVVEGSAPTNEKRLAFLRAHSPQLAGTRACRSNCWALELKGKTLPASVAASDAAYWRKVVLPTYLRIERRARELVAGAAYEKPCRVQPVTWGAVGRLSPEADDREKAAQHGLVPIGCEGTLNDGFAARGAVSSS